jgi:cytochrome c oxidase assembly protein subunit 11
MKRLDKNTRVLLGLAAVIGLMIGLVSQAEPIYRMFCGATGLGGTTQNAAMAPAQTKDRYVTVSFDANTDPTLPWDFAPEARSLRVKLGEVAKVTFRVQSHSARTTIGTAVHNVQPDKAGLYFDKLQCFCFTKQVLKPGEARELPVQFFVDPALANDREEDDVRNITLSYTFYLAKDQSKAHTQISATSSSSSNP